MGRIFARAGLDRIAPEDAKKGKNDAVASRYG